MNNLDIEAMSIDEYDKPIYEIHNKDEEFLGEIRRKRVGQFMHWCFEPVADTYFTNGCLKEISLFITKCYSPVNEKEKQQ